ncbi:hypothetical protein FQA39_LY13219 [Lamprigera yunnana]|nr:hypothetical protein FQA39_LY13219 [Lamprigera yunnana]
MLILNSCTSLVKVYTRTMSTEQNVIFKTVANAGVITLNRPKSLNALSLSMIEQILSKLIKWEKDKKLVIIKGAGERAFCAGGDVRLMAKDCLKGGRTGINIFRTQYMTSGCIGRYKIPYVALIDGVVMGGGVGLSIHGHYRIATEHTLFAMPEVAIGLIPDVGASYFFPRLQGNLGTYLALTGYRLKGSDVYEAGIATHYCESQYLHEIENSLLKCNNHSDIKRVLEKFNKKDEKPFSLEPVMNQINKCFAPPTIELILNELESDGTEWSKETLRMLRKMSPTSLKITMKALHYGTSLDLDECLQMEFRISYERLRNKDFSEGVRAVLIDKDQKPQWSPSSVNDVTDEMVNSYFRNLKDEPELVHKL